MKSYCGLVLSGPHGVGKSATAHAMVPFLEELVCGGVAVVDPNERSKGDAAEDARMLKYFVRTMSLTERAGLLAIGVYTFVDADSCRYVHNTLPGTPIIQLIAPEKVCLQRDLRRHHPKGRKAVLESLQAAEHIQMCDMGYFALKSAKNRANDIICSILRFGWLDTNYYKLARTQ